MEDIVDIIVTETTNLIEITSQPTDEIIDVNIIDNREDVTLNVTPTLVEININSLTGNFGILWGEIEGTLSNQTDLQNALNLKADLVDGKVPSSQLPSYVDDVVEVANYAALPVTGEVGKIYITLDTNYIYRWTGSTYVEIKDSSAVWGTITGTLSNQTDLQNALNLKANDSLVVHLAGAETITGAKTFSSAVIAPNFVLSGGTGNTGLYYGHTDRVVLANYTTGGIDFEVNGGSIVATLFPSGNYGLGITLDAGYKLDVNGTARISGALSGTSASFSNSVTASSIIKSGGTSSQFLKADGSIDTNTYLTTSSAASTYVSGSGVTDYYARFTGTKVIADGFIRTTSNITYVEGMGLSTGNGLDIQGNYGAGGGGLKIRSYDETTGNAYIDFANTGGRMYLGLNRSTSGGLMTNATAYATVLTTGLGTSNLEFGTNATKRMTIDGTTGAVTLTSALSGTSATFSGAINLTGTANSFQVASIFRNANRVFFGGDTGGYYFQNSGNTATVLQIADSGAATFSSSVTIEGNNSTIRNGNELRFNRPDNAIYTRMYDAGSLAPNGFTFDNMNAEGFHFKNNGSTIMRMNSSGNVGIGTTSPASKLYIEGTGTGAWLTINRTDTGTNIIDYTQSGTRLGYIGYIGSELWIYNATASDISIRTSTFERMRITSGGNVGIGTSSPETITNHTSLTINGTSVSRMDYKVSGVKMGLVAATTSQFLIYSQGEFPLLLGTNDTERMRITSGGDLNIGGTGQAFNSVKQQIWFTGSSSQYGLSIAALNVGSTRFIDFNIGSGSGGQAGSISWNGSVVAYNITSDYRLKEDLKPINGLEIVNKIKVYDYKWKADNSRMDGVLAHELQEVLPYAVTGIKDGEQMQSVDYSKIVPVLIQSIKDLKAELDTISGKV